MQFNLSSPLSQTGEMPEALSAQDMGFGDHAADIGMGVVRGLAGAGEAIYDLADWVTGDYLPDAEDNFGLGHSKTLAGGLAEGITQFMVGFVPGMGALSWAGRATGLAAKVGKASKATQWAASFGKAAAAGAIADFAVFDAQEARLSNLIQKYPSLQNPITEFLAADEDDTEIEGRLKNLMEGGILGGMMEPFMIGLRAMRAGRNARAMGESPKEATKQQLEPLAKQIKEADEPVRIEIKEAEKTVAASIEEAATPSQATPRHEHINLDRVTSRDATLEVVKSMRSGDYNRLVTRKSMTDAELAAEVNPHTADIADMLGEPDPGDLIARLTAHGAEGRNFVYRQAAIRDHADRLMNEADAAIKRHTDSGLDEELIHADQIMILANEFLIAAREGGTVLGQGLRAQKRIAGEGVIPDARPKDVTSVKADDAAGGREGIDRVMPEDMYRGDSPEAVATRQAYFEAVGGGNIERGRKVMKQRATTLKNIKDAQGSAAAVKAAKDFATKPQMLVEYWMNSILSGPLTHMVNMTSNTINTLFLPFEKALGNAATFQFKEAGESLKMYAHLHSQFSDAWTAATTAFKDWGDDLDNLTIMDTNTGFNRAISARNLKVDPDSVGGAAIDFIGKALNLPSRFLIAEDSFFKHLNYRATVRAGLFKEGAQQNKIGAELAEHVEGGMDTMIKDSQFYSHKNVRLAADKFAREQTANMSPGPARIKAHKSYVTKYMADNWDEERGALALAARQYGRMTTYTQALNDPDRAGLVKAADKWNNLVNDVPFLRIVTPFVRTPTNLAAFFLDRSAGLFVELGKSGFKGSVKHWRSSQKEIAQAIREGGESRADVLGRISTGSMLFYGGYLAYNSGTLTGGGPSDPQRRKTLEATGWQPYSFRVGDEWYSYRRFDPFASFFGTVADIGEALREAPPEESGSLEALMGAVITAAAKNVTNKSYLTGMARVANVLSNPDRYGSAYLEQTVASMVPFSSAAGQTLGSSEFKKEIRSVLDAVRAKYGLTGETDLAFLGITTRVEDRRDMLGDKVARPSLALNALPIHYSEVNDDIIMNELSVLGHQSALGAPPRVSNGVDMQAYTNFSGQTAYDRWAELHGQVRIRGRSLKQTLKKLIKSSKYQALPLEDLQGMGSPRMAELRKVLTKFRAAAREQVMQEFPELGNLDNRNTQIKAYRRAGRDIQSLLDY